ncbi:MAG TPA: polysaccharide deacetylase family protein [Solirubrobacterales bacterium]|nr:polysaccharide deacetylase family protein [Solirubrobacterales bacterium]
MPEHPRPSLPILMYHSISDDPGGRNGRPLTVTPGTFAEHIEYLAGEGFSGHSVRELVAAREGSAELGPKPVILTFDDAYGDFHAEALPVLVRHGFSATVYVTTGYIGSATNPLTGDRRHHRPVLSLAQLRELVAAGIECGGHSHTHPQLDDVPPARLAEEVRRPKEVLEEGLQTPVTTFAYPYGYHDRAAKEAVAAAGYLAACRVGNLACEPDDDRFALPRLTVRSRTDVRRLGRLVRRGPSALGRVRASGKDELWRFVRRHSPLGERSAG